MTRFDGETSVIVGGSSGMGRGAARAIAARGGDVVVTSRSADKLDDAVRRVKADLRPLDRGEGLGTVAGVVCDLSDAESIRAAIEAPAALDHLIVTAAPGRGVTDRAFFDGKFWGTQIAAEAAARRLPRHGTMLFTSGGLTVHPAQGQWAVTCAFAAVEALARALAVELAPRRVNCIRPGLFDTESWSAMDPGERERFMAERARALPTGRVASAEDFGDAVLGVLGARYLTGQVVVLDGGEALLGG